MNAFESIVAKLLRRQGYWTTTSYKVNLTKDDKIKIGRPSSPRWEVDIVAYQGATNSILVVECKSYLDSNGVVFRDGGLSPAKLYKLFTEPITRQVILSRLADQLVEEKLCAPNPTVRLGLATGNISRSTKRDDVKKYFDTNQWVLFDDYWIKDQLSSLQNTAYENDEAFVAAKLVLRDIK